MIFKRHATLSVSLPNFYSRTEALMSQFALLRSPTENALALITSATVTSDKKTNRFRNSFSQSVFKNFSSPHFLSLIRYSICCGWFFHSYCSYFNGNFQEQHVYLHSALQKEKKNWTTGALIFFSRNSLSINSNTSLSICVLHEGVSRK